MSIETLAFIALQASVFLTVLTTGIGTSGADLRYVLSAPSRLVRPLFAMKILGTTVVIAVCAIFSLHPAMIVALVALAIAPVNNTLPKAMLSLLPPGRAAYAHGLFFASSIMSVLLTPLAVELINILFGGDDHVSPLAVTQIVVQTVLLPLCIGMAIGHRWTGRAWIPTIQKISGLVLLVCAAVLVADAWGHFGSIVRDGTLTAILIIVAAGLFIGHFVGGPSEDERTVLAHATVSRHPGIAVAVASLTDQPLAPAGVLLAVVLSSFAILPYTSWRKRLRERSSTNALPEVVEP